MKLSIVIVNYNVKYFLEQCLISVQKACKGISSEIFVVDNNSVDGSVKMLREKFKDVILIANTDNKGFSKANNQAIRKSKGEYVLLLNPDTIVEDDTFRKVVLFMDEHPDGGGLGVKMIDGNGKYLPESKRGFPSPEASFYKIFGLSKLFPKSKMFSKYHLGYLDKEKTYSVDVLAGAFMLLRKSVLDKIGLLDESFFMYGEDIDLSYRIVKAGYKNYYYPETRIIHYKGESTKKSSVNYVVIFYKAMVIFAKKHLSKKNAKLFSFLINIAIYFRAFLAICTRYFKKGFKLFLDIILLYIGIFFIKGYWEQSVIFPDGGQYPDVFIFMVVPLYILIWLFSVYLSGGYDRPLKPLKIFTGISIGTIIILVAYALLPESYRFSRAIILIGAIWGLISMMTTRYFLQLLFIKENNNKRFVIIGEKEEVHRVSDLLNKTLLKPDFIGFVSTTINSFKNSDFIGNINQIKDIISIYKISDVVFCSKDISHQEIIDKMSELHESQVNYKIAPEDSLSIIGSKSINTSEDLFIISISSIIKSNNKRSKRFLDIITSLIFLITFPVGLLFVKKPGGFLKNIFRVLSGNNSWVGYYEKNTSIDKLPRIKPGITNPVDVFKNKKISVESINKLNLFYARDYKAINDFNIIIRNFTLLGR